MTYKASEEEQMEARFTSPIATVIGHDGNCAIVRSIAPKKEFERGGSKHGYQYEWRVNHSVFTAMPLVTQVRLSLTESEYHEVEKQFKHCYDHDKKEWYDR